MTSTTTRDRTGVRGLAVYFECRGADSNGMVAQFLFIQEMVSPLNGEIVPFQVVSRVVSESNPQRTWRNGIAEDYKSDATVSPKKDLLKSKSLPDALLTANKYFAYVSNAIDATVANSWEFYKFPLVIEVSDADATNIQKLETPRGLLERLTRLRSSQGFDALPGKKA